MKNFSEKFADIKWPLVEAGTDMEFVEEFALAMANSFCGKEYYKKDMGISWFRIGELITTDDEHKERILNEIIKKKQIQRNKS